MWKRVAHLGLELCSDGIFLLLQAAEGLLQSHLTLRRTRGFCFYLTLGFSFLGQCCWKEKRFVFIVILETSHKGIFRVRSYEWLSGQ